MIRTPATPTFEMTVDLNVLEHLGINLYSNIAAVLTEAVANAWDADASSVQIRVDPNSEWIEIEDDGALRLLAALRHRGVEIGRILSDQADVVHVRAMAAAARGGNPPAWQGVSLMI